MCGASGFKLAGSYPVSALCVILEKDESCLVHAKDVHLTPYAPSVR